MKQTLKNIITQMTELKQQHSSEGFELVGIFGSYARGSADVYSDVDVAYRLDYDVFDSQFKGGFSKLLRIEEIKKELENRLQLKVDLVPLNSANSRFRNNISKDILYV